MSEWAAQGKRGGPKEQEAQVERRFAVLGTPIEHSLSSLLHAAVFRACGLPWETVLIDPETDEGFARFVEELRAPDSAYDGANVTIPYKERAAALCDRRTPVAERCGAVNTLTRADGLLLGGNSDAGGFLEALRRELNVEAGALRNVLICGTGGVARAVATALCTAGAGAIAIFSRTETRATSFVSSLRYGNETTVWRAGSYADIADLVAADERFDLLVNATPVGMMGDEVQVLPGPWVRAHAGRVFDVVYRRSSMTPLVRAAQADGIPATDGLQMLIEQAVLSLMAWGLPAKSDEVRAIMKQALVDEGISRCAE